MTTDSYTDVKSAAAHAASSKARQRIDFAIFLGPSIILLILFFVGPVILDVIVAFTDIGASLQFKKFTLENFDRMVTRDARLASSLGLTLVYVFATLAVFNVTLGLILALVTTSIPEKLGGFFRSVWLLPRMSPSVVYVLLWAWVIDPTPHGLLNQFLQKLLGLPGIDMMNNSPLALIVIANGFIGASMGMIIFTSAIRSIPEHLFYASHVDGAGGLRTMWHITLPAIRWPLSFITVYQTLSLLVSFEYIWLITDGGPFFDTTVFALYVYKRAFQSGQYAYGAALALILVIIGISAAMLMWRFMDMKRLLQEPKIEVS